MTGGDHTKFLAFVRRILQAAGRRIEDADVEDLAELVALRAAVDEAIANAVAGMRARGASWAEIGRAVGITKQSAYERWAVRETLTPGGEAS